MSNLDIKETFYHYHEFVAFVFVSYLVYIEKHYSSIHIFVLSLIEFELGYH